MPHTHIHLHLAPRKTRDAVAHDPKNGQFTSGSGGGGGAAKPPPAPSKSQPTHKDAAAAEVKKYKMWKGAHSERIPVGSTPKWSNGAGYMG